MSWSYDTTLTEARDKVRFLIQDTDISDQLLSNEEIAFAITDAGGDNYRAAVVCCRSIALKLGRRPSVRLSIAGLDAHQQYEHYMKLAAELESKAALSGSAGVFAGGISLSDKATRESDTDRVPPGFTVDMHRNVAG